jgi:hypothetical protein
MRLEVLGFISVQPFEKMRKQENENPEPNTKTSASGYGTP